MFREFSQGYFNAGMFLYALQFLYSIGAHCVARNSLIVNLVTSVMYNR
jgi:hypothetical protein